MASLWPHGGLIAPVGGLIAPVGGLIVAVGGLSACRENRIIWGASGVALRCLWGASGVALGCPLGLWGGSGPLSLFLGAFREKKGSLWASLGLSEVSLGCLWVSLRCLWDASWFLLYFWPRVEGGNRVNSFRRLALSLC